MTPTDGSQFFEEQSETSRRKIEVYVKYLRPLAYKLLHGYQRLWVVDAYAGAGIYGEDAIGSPLAAARMAEKFNVQQAEARRRGRMQLINVEADPERFKKLDNLLIPYRKIATSKRGRFQDHLDDILDMIQGDPVLFFIDPFGMEGSDIRLIEQILDRRARTVTELLINFSHSGFRRMAGNLDATGPKSSSSRAAAATKVRELSASLGTEWWKGAWRNPSLSSQEKIETVVSLYEAQLRDRGIEHVHGVPMRKAFDKPPGYHLVFATQSTHGVFLMSDIVNRSEEKLFEETYEGTFDVQLRRNRLDEERVELRKEVHAYGLARQEPTTPVQIYRHFAPLYFGKWRQKDYDQCIRALVDEQGIVRGDPVGIGKGEKLTFAPLPQEDLFRTL